MSRKVNRITPFLERSSGRGNGRADGNGSADVAEGETLAGDQGAYLFNEVGDDRDAIQPGDLTLLIVENDLAFARLILEAAHEKGFKAGLWLAPFLMGAKSQLYSEHPEWAVQHRPGKPSIVPDMRKPAALAKSGIDSPSCQSA